MPNRLINETSPYLLQHANNPVDWYSWGPEALEQAKVEDKPILLSVGYSACHWCHVMEKESFENHATAKLMNKNFICIKVDREERPDIDSIYMKAVQAMTGSGGWPMTVFLTPNAEPFYGGTYFPPEDRSGLPGFPKVLKAIADSYLQNRSEILLTTNRILEHIKTISRDTSNLDPITDEILEQSFRNLAPEFDNIYGGFGTHPKFPQPMMYEFLLRYYIRFQNPRALEMVEVTLDNMAEGGIYDQLGGGFHRYSTDTSWLTPHFEKMLYDNALLVKLYLHAYQVTRKPLYSKIAQETLDYVIREMTDPMGGFYSAQDADSEGEEGKFFVWRPKEIIETLGEINGNIVNRHFGITEKGNFEGTNILSVVKSSATVASEVGMPEYAVNELLQSSKNRLLEVRRHRVHPEIDDKILTSWNALMLTAFAEASTVLNRPDYAEIAKKNATFLLNHLEQNGRLLRSYKKGSAKLNAYLEDYAFLTDALIFLHEATFEKKWIQEAVRLGNAINTLFWDETSGRFYDTGKDHEKLVMRPCETIDNAIPSGSSMAAQVLLRLALITGQSELKINAETAIKLSREIMTRFPSGTGNWLCALDFYTSKPKEIAIIGERFESNTRALTSELFRGFLPNRVLVGKNEQDNPELDIPLLQGRKMVDNQATAYVCQDYVCKLPVTDPDSLAIQLSD